MSDKNFPDVVREIHSRDTRYGKGAYYFIREALDHTLKVSEKKASRKAVTFLEMNYLKEFGNMPLSVLGP